MNGPLVGAVESCATLFPSTGVGQTGHQHHRKGDDAGTCAQTHPHTKTIIIHRVLLLRRIDRLVKLRRAQKLVAECMAMEVKSSTNAPSPA